MMVRPAPRPKKKRTLMSPTTVTLTSRPNFRLILPGDPCPIVLWRDGQPPYDQDAR